MIDTHTHLYLPDSFPDGGKEAVGRALEAGVDRMIMPNIDVSSVEPLLKLHNSFPLNTFVAAGLHPTEVTDRWKDDMEEIFFRFADCRLVAIGEIGLDLHWEKKMIVKQMDAFAAQLETAFQRNLPAIVHSRDASAETVEVLKMMGSQLPALIFHSFTYSPKEADAFLSVAENARFGFNGVITFKNAEEVREAARFVGVDRIVAETDSPYLAPVPFRGSQNESAYLPFVLEGISKALSLGFDEAVEIITRNSELLFNLKN